MNESIKYPQKYAVLEVKEKGGWAAGYEEETLGYIPSKCYLVETTTRYKADGNQRTIHNVVFPYKNISQFRRTSSQEIEDLGEPEEPRYHFYYQLANGNEVPYIFESYEEAEYLAKLENEKLLAEKVASISFLNPDWKVKYDMKIKQAQDELALCEQFAQVIQNQLNKEEVQKLTKK